MIWSYSWKTLKSTFGKENTNIRFIRDRLCFKSSGEIYLNGSHLAKMKKYIPYMSLPYNVQGRSSWFEKFKLYFKNYDFCEYVKFLAISWKFDILSITALIKIPI